MPRIDAQSYAGANGNFGFTGARIEHLSATEYTLATLVVDVTGSVSGFQDQLLEMVRLAVQGCQKSPRSDNLLLRYLTFNSSAGVTEVHGFKPLAEVDAAAYAPLVPGGATNLTDACYSAVAAVNAYGQRLVDQDYGANAVTFIVTDGDDNVSTMSPSMLRAELERSVTGEVLESHVSILIGINATQFAAKLDAFRRDAGITQFVDAGDATRGRLAKLAAFVSRSVSSTAQALGTGGPSQSISATI